MDKKTSDLAKVLAEFGAEISILYVEDDEISQEIIFKFLSHYFKKIEVATSGVEGLELYKKRGGFSLVISTTYMPIMTGYEMCRDIREINELQPIIITSQNSNNECLIKLIELGIDGFLLKPIDYKQFIKILYKVCKNIYDNIMVNRYENMILDSNITLQQKNIELEEALFKLEREENKNIYLSEVIKNNKNIDDETLSFLTHKSEALSALEFFEVYPLSLEDKEDSLETILEEIDIGINGLNNSLEHREKLSIELLNLSQIIYSMIEFNNIANSFKSLSIAFIEIETIENIEIIKSLMFALLDNLRDWLEHVFIDKSAIDIHYMDNSFVNDSLAIEAMLRNTHHEDDDETCDIFF